MSGSQHNKGRALGFSCLILVLNLFHIGFGQLAHSHQHRCGSATLTTNTQKHHTCCRGARLCVGLRDLDCDSHLTQETESCCVAECLDYGQSEVTTIPRVPHIVAIASSAESHLLPSVQVSRDVDCVTIFLVWPNAPPDSHLGRAPPCSTGFCSFRRATL